MIWTIIGIAFLVWFGSALFQDVRDWWRVGRHDRRSEYERLGDELRDDYMRH